LPGQPLLYTELASWWRLLSPVEEYAEEVEVYLPLLQPGASNRALLELGSGGGNNAYYLKQHFEMTLVDLSPHMMTTSREINADLPHHEGDMRSVRLGRTFDSVFIHDAIMYLTTEDDLRAAFDTAAIHLRPGGRLLLAPDFTRELFEPSTDHGGVDEPSGRGLRYLEWTYDPDPTDTAVIADFAYLLREADGSTRALHDRHINGIFPEATGRRLLADAGFEIEKLRDRWDRDLFFGTKRG